MSDGSLRFKKSILSSLCNTRVGRAGLLRAVGPDTAAVFRALEAISTTHDSTQSSKRAKRTLKLAAKAALLISNGHITAMQLAALKPAATLVAAKLIEAMTREERSARHSIHPSTYSVAGENSTEMQSRIAGETDSDVEFRNAGDNHGNIKLKNGNAHVFELHEAMKTLGTQALALFRPHVTAPNVDKAEELLTYYSSPPFLEILVDIDTNITSADINELNRNRILLRDFLQKHFHVTRNRITTGDGMTSSMGPVSAGETITHRRRKKESEKGIR